MNGTYAQQGDQSNADEVTRPRLSIRNLYLDIDPDGDDPIKLQLDDLDLAAGQSCVIYGKSGIGKTTLLEVLAGLRHPSAADQIVLRNMSGAEQNLSHLYQTRAWSALVKLRAGPVGYVPQGGAILPFLSARRNVLLGSSNQAVSETRLQDLACGLEMEAHLNKFRAALSGGQRKRVALMRGLIQPRALLLLDEPTAGLDSAMADRALSLILDYVHAEGSAALIVMHDMERAQRLGLHSLELVRDSGSRVSFLSTTRDIA